MAHQLPVSRRDVLKQAALGGTFAALSGRSLAFTAEENKPAGKVRDRLWVWAHAVGSYDNAWGLPGNSRLTPIEGARYLGVPNLIMIRYSGKPEPPFEEYAAPFRSLQRVYWSITGAGGATSADEREAVYRLAANMPNIAGVFMDDFFQIEANDTDASPAKASLTPDELRAIRDRLRIGNRRLDVGVTLYMHQLSPKILRHIDLCDVVSLWTWRSEDLNRLEQNFAKFRELAPAKRVLLGLYMWDFGTNKPMPVDRMKHQCDLALKWLRAGQIEGMIFLATNICDLKLETVEWTRNWIASVGDEKL